MMSFSLRLPALASCQGDLEALVGAAESVSRQLRAWLDTLQNSDIEGQRRLNEQTRRAYGNRQRVAAFGRQQAVFRAHMEEGLRNGTWGRPQSETPDRVPDDMRNPCAAAAPGTVPSDPKSPT